MMTVKQISVFLENVPGTLVGLTEALSQHNIDLRAMAMAETKEYGILRMIVSDVFATSTILKDAGYVHSLTPVLAVAIPDVPGGLNNVLQVLASRGINVDYMYAFLGNKSGSAYVIIRVEDNNAATQALQSKGIRLVSSEDMENL